MKNIAIIPARSGSKGLKDKNIKKLCGKPLIAYSIEAAIASGVFDEIMVSTDSEQYAEIAREYGAKVPFLRSEENASDTASSWDVVRETLEKYKQAGHTFDTVCLLQPTSPLRTSQDIADAYALYKTKSASTVIGVCETEHSPLWTNTISDSLSMDNFVRKEAQVPRQMLSTFYRINGAMYIVSVDRIMKKENIYHNSYAYIMPQQRSIDIDSNLDFIIAESIFNYTAKKDRLEV